MTPTEAWYYYVTDFQGDVMQILDAGGNTVASYTYNAWGKILNLNNSTSANIGDLNPIRYRGYYYDTETGLYYLKSRYYDPEICRFINADSLASTGQGFVGYNMFTYCNDSPVIFKDSNGRMMTFCVNITDGRGGERSEPIDYIIYYENAKSSGNLTEPAYKQSYTDNAYYSSVGTKKAFIDTLNSLPNNVNNVYIYAHGSFGALEFYKESLYANEISAQLQPVSISGDIYLFACHGAFIADAIACASGETVYAAAYGVSFENGRARNGLKWALLGIFGDDLQGWFVYYPDGHGRKYSNSLYF